MGIYRLRTSFDSIPLNFIEWALRRKDVVNRLVMAIMIMYSQGIVFYLFILFFKLIYYSFIYLIIIFIFIFFL